MQSLTRRLATAGSRPAPKVPVRIALVITDLDIGGASAPLVNLATRLDRRRWSPLVVSLGEEGPLAEVVRQACLPCECLACSPRRPVQVVTRLARALRRWRPELVQSFLFHANLATRLAAPLGRTALGCWRPTGRRTRAAMASGLRSSHGIPVCGSVCVSHGVLAFSRELEVWIPGD